MRSVALNLVVAFALFGVALANSDRQQVADAYRAYIQAHADRDAHRVCNLMDPDDLRRERDESVALAIDRCARERYELPGWMSAEGTRRWQTLVNTRVVDVDVDGDYATASLRAGACTLPIFDAEFRRADDGRWHPYFVSIGPSGPVPMCWEREEIPPLELAWTWQGREWR